MLLKNLNIALPYDPAIPLLGIHQRNATQVTPEETAVYSSSSIHNSQVMETAKLPHYRQMD
jgi:hypothetical protein